MKKFFITSGIVTVIGSFLLYYLFYYPLIVIIYHLLVISGICFLVFALNRFAGYIKVRVLRILIQNIICFSFFLSLCVFYLVILGSNEFWGKAIELQLLLSYIPSLNNLIQTLPVQSWILYLFLILFLLLVCSIYYFIRPRGQQNKVAYLKGDLVKLGIAILIIVIFFKPLIEIKRYINLAGEPVLEFIFPKMWQTKSEMNEYKKMLISNGLKDKPCIDQLKNEPVNQNNRNFVIILVDALRRDFLSAYGYYRPTTPFLDSMVKSKSITKIEYPFSPSTATVSGVANLFSSKELKDFSFSGLNLMKYLKFKKYTTYAFLTGQHTNWYGLANIYKNDCDYFFEGTSGLEFTDNDLLTLKKFNSTKLNDQFFAYIHLLSAHALGQKNDEFKKYLPDKIGLNVEKKQALINNYDNGILQADFVIRQIFEKLSRDSQLKNTTIIILADHGELFGEDGRWAHSGSIEPYLQSIPMLIYDQDLNWYKNTYSATLLDIAPTIADRLGYPIPKCWTGRSLHQTLKDFEVELESSSSDKFPFGILRNRDSTITMDLLDKNRVIKKRYQMNNKDNNWVKTQIN